jgi:hypothetical protein
MKMNSTHSLWLLLLLMCSCTTPSVITTISPEAPEGQYANGRKYIPLESDQIAVELGYDGIMDDKLIFDFVVLNSSRDTLLIHPAGFFYVVLDSANAESDFQESWFSLHPDTVSLAYDQSLEEKEKLKGKNAFLGILQASFDLLYNTSGFLATEDPGFIVDAVFSTAGTADQYITLDRKISEEMDMINEEKEQVNQEIFRMNKLAPGQACSGYVFFPLHEHCAFYMFCFPVGKQLFQFVYRQQKELVY